MFLWTSFSDTKHRQKIQPALPCRRSKTITICCVVFVTLIALYPNFVERAPVSTVLTRSVKRCLILLYPQEETVTLSLKRLMRDQRLTKLMLWRLFQTRAVVMWQTIFSLQCSAYCIQKNLVPTARLLAVR
jgi:hypothetical protein